MAAKNGLAARCLKPPRYGRVGQSRRHDHEGGISIVGEADPHGGPTLPGAAVLYDSSAVYCVRQVYVA